MSEFKFPTEEVELPSKGLVYPKDNPLSSGKVEIKYMTAKEEDILTNQSYIQKGTVLDKLLESVIVNKDIDVNDIIVGDKNALLITTRILGYGKKYEFRSMGEKHIADLTDIKNKQFDISDIEPGKNEFSYTLPHTNALITYKLLTNRDEKKVNDEVKGLKKINKQSSPELSTRLKHMITSVNGDTENKTIRKFIDNQFLAIDSRAFRDHVRDTQPDVDLTISTDRGEEVRIPIGISFFWPDA